MPGKIKKFLKDLGEAQRLESDRGDIEGGVRRLSPPQPNELLGGGGMSKGTAREIGAKIKARERVSENFKLPREARSTPKGDRVKSRAKPPEPAPEEGAYDPYNARNPKAAPKKKGTLAGLEDIRHMDPKEAIKRARKGEHLIPKEGGGFRGAPEQAQTMADIRRLRRQFDKDVGLGGGGADWYARTHDWIQSVAGPDPVKQSQLARSLALFSAQADPDTNLGFALQAHNAAISGQPLSKVRTGAQATTFNEAFDAAKEAKAAGIDMMDPNLRASVGHNSFLQAPWEIKLGKKTGIFGEHMDPTRENPTTGTNDIWHARALGYTKNGKPWDSALTEQQHKYMDYETVLAVDRANKAKLLGREDWTPGEIQAAPWVYRKALGLMNRYEKKFPTLEAALAEASKTYPEYAPKYTAGGTHEVIPGETTNHMTEAVQGGREARDEYSSDPRYWWTRGNDPSDILYRSQDVLTEPTTPHVGIFGDKINQGQTAHPLLSFQGSGKNRTLDAPSNQFLEGTEAFRSFANAQDAGAGSIFLGGLPVSKQNAYSVTLPGSTEADVLAARDIASREGLNALIHHGGNRAIATNFTDEGPVLSERGSRVAKRINEAFGAVGGSSTPGAFEGPLVEHDWSQPGQGIASEGMLNRLSEPQMEAFGKPEVRQVVGDINRADMEKLNAGTAGSYRPDIMNSRAVLEQLGPEGLRKALTILQTGGLPALQQAIKAGRFLMPFFSGGLAQNEEDRTLPGASAVG